VFQNPENTGMCRKIYFQTKNAFFSAPMNCLRIQSPNS
jgi:hypothetical protein